MPSRFRRSRVMVATVASLAVASWLTACGGGAPSAPAPHSTASVAGSQGASSAAAAAGQSPAAGQASTSSLVPDQATLQKLTAGARKEGVLNLAWSPTWFDSGRAVGAYQAAFDKMFGFNVKLHFIPAPNMVQMMAQLTQQAKAGQTPSTDLWMGTAGQTAQLIQQHVLVPVDWRSLMPSIPAQAVAPGNTALEYATWFPDITYATNTVPPSDVPHTLADVLQPKWKGRVASTPYAAGFNHIAAFYGKTKTFAYVQKLSQQIGGLIRCGDTQHLTDGEYDMLVLDCGPKTVQAQMAQGQPLDFVVPRDAFYLDFWLVGLPKGTPHPDAATLFSLFLDTPQGQATSWKYDYTDLYWYPKSHDRALLQPVVKGLDLSKYTADVAADLKNPQYQAYLPQLVKILQHK